MPAKATTIDGYLSSVKPEHRAALEKLRRVIQKMVPDARECISYGLAAFRWKGKPLVAFGAAIRHCALYPMSPAVIAQYEQELSGYETSKGTIRFVPDKPLPVALLRKLVKARQAEIGGRV